MIYVPEKGSFKGMKSKNRSVVLNMIRIEGAISRAEIAKKSKLTRPTVSSIVQELIDEELITETLGEAKVQGGRKPIILKINGSNHYTVGLYAAAEVIHAAVANLNGEIIFEINNRLDSPPPKKEFLGLLSTLINKCIAESQVDTSSVIGIGVAMHGIVDSEKGIASYSPHLNLEDIHIKEYLEKKHKIPVLVENDVRTLTLAESWYGEGKDISNFIVISIGLGIGSGIVINNDIYHGPIYSAGEIGHTVVDINGPRCTCGNNGCLEALASEDSVLKDIQRKMNLGRPTILKEWINNSDELTIPLVQKAVENKDPLACESLETAGRYLGFATANLINLLTPEKVIFEGRIFESADAIMAPIKSTIHQSVIRPALDFTEIAISNMGKQGMVVGAYTLVIRELFSTGSILEM